MHWLATEARPEPRRPPGYDRRMLRRLLSLVATAAALAGCGSDDPELPAACTRGEDAVRAALREAPGEVRLDGAPLSSCLSGASDGDQLETVGIGLVETAASLAQEARREPEGDAALQLGYLVAAAHRGGSEEGPHAELLRRLDQELTAIDTSSDAFRRGERAGRTGG
jgi:hypothetical protein